MKTSYSFLAIGKTKESTEGGDFKRYIGVGSTKVLAVNPTKEERDKLLGYESQFEPEYTGSDDDGKFARVSFIVETDPDVCNGIDIKNTLTFTLRPVQAYNRDKTKLQAVDDYGNSSWGLAEDVNAGKQLLSSKGSPLKIASKYHIACQGEADLTAFLKAYLNVDDAFNYANGSWTLKDNAADCLFKLEHIKDYFNGDFSEIKDALKLQPNNKVKLLYGVKTVEKDGVTQQRQAIATSGDLILRNSANSNALTRLAKNLADAKNAGKYANVEYAVQELAEYDVKPTDLSQPAAQAQGSEASDDMPWDM